MEEKESYVENLTFYSPHFQNGVYNLGDLWNCRSSKAIGHNIFKANAILAEQLRTTHLDNFDYTLTHVKSELETAKSLNIEGHLSLELLLGHIKLEGNMKYQKEESDKTHTEVISCHYIHENCRIDVSPPVEPLINEHVLEMITSGKIEATHVVGGMIVGCSVTALIEIKNKEYSKDSEVTGQLGIDKGVSNKTGENNQTSKWGWLNKVIGSFSGEVKAEWEEKEKSNQLDIQINCKARPMPSGFSPPSSVKQLFELIEKMPSALSGATYLSDSTGHGEIRGVPIQFILYPIAQFAKIDIIKLYKKLEDDLLDKFQEMLSKAIQIQHHDYIKQLMLIRDKQLSFLLNKKSILSDKVKALEKELKCNGGKFVAIAREQLELYKNGKCETAEFGRILQEFDASIVSSIEEKIQELADEGALEIFEAQGTDESNIKRFTDIGDRQKWIHEESGSKIIFEIGPQCPRMTICGYHQIVTPLNKIGIKTALMMPSIAKEVKLSLMFEDHEVAFKESEVQQVIEILCANFRIGNQTRAEFFAIIAAKEGIEFPVHTMNSSKLDITLQTMIELAKDYSHFEFVDSINDFQRRIKKLQSDHVAFCLPIEAPETALDFFQYWKDYNIKNVTWIIHSFGFDNEQEIPLLFVLSKTDALAICLDRLDLLILKKRIKEARQPCDINFDLFAVDQLNISFNMLRASSAFRFLSRIAPNSIKTQTAYLRKAETNSEVTEFLSFVRRCLKLNELIVLSAVAQMAVDDFPALTPTLEKCGWKRTFNEFSEEVFDTESCKKVVVEIENWLEDDTLTREIDKAEELLSDSSCLSKEKCLAAREIVANHSHCPAGFKFQLQQCQQSGETESIEKVINILKKLRLCDKVVKSHFSFLHVRMLLSALNFVSHKKQSVEELIKRLIEEYYKNINWDFPGELMDKYIQNNQLYLLSQQISPYKYDRWRCTLHKGLNALHDFDDYEALAQLMQDLSEVSTDVDCIAQIWKNEKWLHIVRNCINVKQTPKEKLLRAIVKWIKNIEGKIIMPDDIQQKLNSMEVVELENIFTVKDVERFLEKVVCTGDDTPWDFKERLATAMRENPSLESDLVQVGAAIHWYAELKLFTSEWSQKDVKLALQKIQESSQSKNLNTSTTISRPIDFKFDLGTSLIGNEQEESSGTTKHREGICFKFIPIMGNEFTRLSDKDYLMVRRVIEYECTSLDGQLLSLLPFLLQQIKLWDGNVLRASRISKLSSVHDEDEEMCSNDPFASEAASADNAVAGSEPKQPLSRLDCIAYVLNTVECTVAQEILRVLSKFPLALSLIIPDIRDENRFIVTLPLLKDIVIRWEASKRVPELSQTTKKVALAKPMIVENHLFSSPFRLVVAVRIGTHHTGKSQILNQVMSYPYYFSSRAEAGNSIGPPCTLDGTVEFTWLTEETCSDEIWTGLLEGHYALGRDEIVLLANLHGNVLDFPAIVKYLNKLASCFIVFLMPNSNRQDWDKLRMQISGNPLYIKVDHGNPQISTSNLIHKDTQSHIIKLLKLALSQKSSNNQDRVIVDVEEPLTYSEEIKTIQSEEATSLINKYSCSDIRKSMAEFLQDGYNNWNSNVILQHLTQSILRILNRSKRLDIKRAMIHVETELSKKSVKESVEPRGQVIEAQRQLQLDKFHIKGKSEDQSLRDDKTKMLNKQLIKESVRVNEANLGLEHFFRVFGEIYRISQGQYNSDANEIKNFPQYYADLLLNGHSIEILNGDNGKIPLDWLRAIFQHVHKRKPNLRVFVISIIGIQSSGKSTLLNALFSCRFAVSVGRCSRGLYMRMVFLDENLRSKGGYDAIILIDTEGLASPEKMNESDAERKDRLLATFAMGLSNLTIISVLGEELTSMTEILQIVIVTMARLRQADVKPDMIVVQHLQERNSQKLNEAKCQFINAIKAAFDLVNKRDVDIGATQNTCLQELISGIEHQDMFFQFSSFKDGSSVHAPPSESYHKDVVHLYQNLIAIAETMPCKLSFERWFHLVENYWNSVTNEKFALNFKNAKKISEFLHYGQRVATIKELIGKAFGFHQEELTKRVRERVSQYLSQKKESQLEQLRQELTNEALSELKNVPYHCSSETCGHCKQISQQIESLLQEVNETEWHKDVSESIKKCIVSKTNNELKIFNQQFDVLVLHNNVSIDAVRLINTAIKEEFKGRSRETPGGNNEFQNYSEREKTDIINKIWDEVIKIAQSKVTGAPLMEEIEKAFDNEYRVSYPDIFEHVTNNLAEDKLKSEPAKKGLMSFLHFEDNKLSSQEHLILISTVEMFVKGIFSSSGYDLQVSKVGMKFEATMIMTIKHNISEMIKGFEKKINTKLKSEFKQWIVLYTFELFIEYMQPVHEKWENKNMPSKILLGKENLYKAEIETRLEHGFSCASDGFVKAGYIIETVKQKALDAGYKIKIQSILDHVWLTNTMKVRLQYFEELALEVKVGSIYNVIAHFIDPKKSIEKWFKQKIESVYSKEKVAKRSMETMKKEIMYILDEIQKSIDFKNLEALLIQYQVPKIQDDTVKETGLNEHDFVMFRDSIKCKIEEFSQHFKHNFDNYPFASQDTDVMDRLGCTEACPWCGALCWGSRGHHEDQGEINKHHTCHQPAGLLKKYWFFNNDVSSRFLDPRVCQDISDSDLAHSDGRGFHGMPWGTVKMNYFGNWKFDSHEIKKLDEMMHWFFQELHKVISQDVNCNPTPEHLLKKFKCDGLKLEDILATVRCIKD